MWGLYHNFVAVSQFCGQPSLLGWLAWALAHMSQRVCERAWVISWLRVARGCQAPGDATKGKLWTGNQTKVVELSASPVHVVGGSQAQSAGATCAARETLPVLGRRNEERHDGGVHQLAVALA
jgi:hypothetical protein